MKRALVFLATLLLISVFGTTTASAGTVFPDVDDDAEYAGAVELMQEYGLFTGDDQGNFNPNANITRAEFTVVICHLLGGEFEAQAFSNSAFTDVPSGHWASKYIAWVADRGVIQGYGNGKFGPSDCVMYEQAVKMLLCAFSYEEAAIDAGGYPYGYISVAEDMNLLDGVTGNVGVAISRANIAVLIANYLEDLS